MTPITRLHLPARRLLTAAVYRLPTWLLSKPWLHRLLDALQLRAPAAAEATLPPPSVDDDDRPRGCGWFDSSLDLQQGLRVEEHTGLPDDDPALADLPLAAWLELQLQGWRAEPPGVQASAFTAVT